MSPRVLAADATGAIDEAARLLRAGELVAFPTETVYGLGALATDERAIARVFEAKGRPRAHPLIAHVDGEESAKRLSADWSDRAHRLALAFWPGPLTLVVPRAAHVPAAIAGGASSIAIRAPSHPVARALLAKLGDAVVAPSANRYQSISPTRAEHVVKSLGSRVALVLDGGACDAGIESTVVDVRGDRARVLRPGALPFASLRAIEPSIEAASAAIADEDAQRASPGMDARHYAPRTMLVTVRGRGALSREASARRARGERVAIVACGAMAEMDAAFDVRALPNDPIAYARALFATLHEIDDAGHDVILVEAVPDEEAWDAVRDRLARASG